MKKEKNYLKLFKKEISLKVSSIHDTFINYDKKVTLQWRNLLATTFTQ